MRSRRIVLLTTGCALALMALSGELGKHPLVFWNSTASVPRGLYLVTQATKLKRGDLVSAWLPTETRALAAERRYLPLTVPIIKPVFALSGDTICATESAVVVSGIEVAQKRKSDTAGRSMPSWTGCKSLAIDQVFLLSTHRPDSFDGRYFGPTERSEIIAVLRPVWTY